MRVGFFLGDKVPQAGGSFTFEENIVNALLKAASKHEFYFFYYGGDRKSDKGASKFVSLSEPTDKINSLVKRALSKPGSPSRLQKAVLQHKIDLMWFIYPYEPVAVPFVFTVLDLQHRIQPFFPEVSVTGNTWDNREEYYGSIIPKAAYTITGTQTGKEEVIKFYRVDNERVKVLPFPTPAFALEQKEEAADIKEKYGISEPYLFYPAQFWPHKNHVVLLHALKILKEKYELDFSLVFTGSDKGNLKYIREKIGELGLSEKVHFLGFVPAGELIGLYKNAFAMTFASLFGPDNLPPLEAFALGCPVIAGNVAGASEQMGDAAMLVDPRSEDEFARAVKGLHDNMELRDSLRERGRVRAAKYTATDYVNGIVAIIDEFNPYRRCWSSEEPYVHT
jgi:glycosyltransferase involved in cell wall biosynthesis